MFKRLHSRTEYEGSGIGLALCKRIVEREGGRIGVEAAPSGQGSSFWFALPIAAEEAHEHRHEPAGASRNDR
jgi:signal transduction histidine kinase